MSNHCTLIGELSSIVPTRENAAVEITSAPQIVVQALPTALGLILWTILEFAHRKRAASNRLRYMSRIFTFLCSCAVTLVAWRFTTVLTCELNQRSYVWNILACAALLGTSLLVLFALAIRRPRLAVLVSFLISSGVVVVDVGLRGWWKVDGVLSAQHLMPLQHLWVLHSISILFHLNRTTQVDVERRRSSMVVTRAPATPRRSVVEIVDSLARRDDPLKPSLGAACSERGRERSNSRV